jgi:subtilisin family serine protease
LVLGGIVATLACGVVLPRVGIAFVTEPGAAACASHDAPAPGAGTCPAGRVVPGRLVVKYRDAVDACAHCLLARGQPFSTVTGSESLDALHRDLDVRTARAVFVDRHGLGVGAARAAFHARVASVRQRFPQRAARARPGATVPDLSAVYELELSPEIDVEVAAARYAADPAVAFAHPLYEARVGAVPNDPYFATTGSWGQSYPDLWGVHALNAAAGWDVSTGAGTVIAVVDTGVDFAHADLAANRWINTGEVPANGLDDDGNGYVDDRSGWDFDGDDNDPLDRYGHGTHVAGTAAAVGDNGAGVVGVAWNARVMAVQGLGDDGDGFTSRLAAGIVYAAMNGADVINNSWGGFGLAEEVYDAIATADALGAVVVSSAGNEGREIDGLLWLPAGHPLGLTVGALAPDGALAGFSNFGPRQSIAAPGVDVLSTRSQVMRLPSGTGVGETYLRLSGTSMASPHVAGLAAVVLGADPSLSTAEARWRIELNADQPGTPGYEGALHNPTFGYGRLDATNVFDPPPVTTRLTPPAITEWHAFAQTTPVPGTSAEFHFTSGDPVAWTLSAPAWGSVGAAAGAGPATIDLTLLAAGLAPASYGGDVILAAPEAVDGGATFGARLHVHASDHLLGPPIVLDQDGWGTILGHAPASASNGISTVVMWEKRSLGVARALIDGAGNVNASFEPLAGSAVSDFRVGTDGHSFVIGWVDYTGDDVAVRVLRVAPDGVPYDAGPVPLMKKRDRYCVEYNLAGIGYDGGVYWVGFVASDYCSDRHVFYVAQLRPDGSFGRHRRVARLDGAYYPLFDCVSGACLFTWLDTRVEAVEPGTGKYIRSAYALPLAGERATADPQKVVTDLSGFTSLANDGDDYFALGQRYYFCAPGDLCRTEVIGARITATGDPIGPEATVISNVAPSERAYPWPGGVVFDGSDWVASYQMTAVDDSPFDDGSYVFVNRVDANGTPLAAEYVGRLVDAAGRASESVIAAAATHAVVTWEDGRTDPLEGIYGHPDFSVHRAQRVFAREPGAAYPDRTIGAIDPVTGGEGELLRFRVVAPGLDPGSTVFAVSGLPSGAAFDPATRLFQWRPDGDDAGSHGGMVFSAASATATVTDTVNIVVAPRIASIAGIVRFADGTPLVGGALKVGGTASRDRTIYTDAAGRYRVEGALVPGKTVTIRLTKPSSRDYGSAPTQARVVAGSGDLLAPDLVAYIK